MKNIYLFVGVLLFSLSSYAQENSGSGTGAAPLSKGQKQLNFGAGFSGHGIPAYVGVDFAVHNDITVGPVVKVVFDDDIRLGFLGRGDYHFNRIIGIPSNWDFYAGAFVGVKLIDGADLDLGLQVGGRYYWSDRWAINLEFGGGTGYSSSLGVSLKF